MPWHILATSAVVYDFFPLRASAHLPEALFSYRKAISYTRTKNIATRYSAPLLRRNKKAVF